MYWGTHKGHLSTRKVIQGRSKVTLELKVFEALRHSKGTQGAWALEGYLSTQSTLVLIVKNFFFGKSNNLETITLVENNMVISDDQKIACIFIQYFDTILPKLGLGIPKDVIVVTISIEDPVLKAFNKYQRHPSILKIKVKYRYLNFFFFFFFAMYVYLINKTN